ncbi:MAG: PaaI family thioesterase [Flavobacteriales bacterium]|nr:PaaI family thioesterase [Flavobacteriales bacterium]
MDVAHYRSLEEMYLSAPLHKFYEGIEISISDSIAELRLSCDQRYFHAAHAVHGSVYFKLLDDAAFFAANSLEKEYFLVTSSFNISLIRPIQTEKIIAKGHVEHQGKNLIIAAATLINEQGKKLAVGRGQFVRSKIPLSPELGYK